MKIANKSQSRNWALAVLGAWVWAPLALAEPAASLPASMDIAALFHESYVKAGAPRIMVFWNKELDDATVTDPARLSAAEMAQARSGARALSEPDRVRLESAFGAELGRAQVHVLDRVMGIRSTHSERDRNGEDSKLIESDAVVGKADVLLEVILIRDFTAPLGTGFKVSATNVHTADKVTEFYTVAMPILPVPSARYVPTDSGFVRWQPPAPIPTVEEVGAKLADEVMGMLRNRMEFVGRIPK